MEIILDIFPRDIHSDYLGRRKSIYKVRLRPETNKEMAQLEKICDDELPLKIEFTKNNYGAGIEYMLCFT